MVNEAPSNLVHPSVGVAVEMLPSPCLEILEKISHGICAVERRCDFSELLVDLVLFIEFLDFRVRCREVYPKCSVCALNNWSEESRCRTGISVRYQ